MLLAKSFATALAVTSLLLSYSAANGQMRLSNGAIDAASPASNTVSIYFDYGPSNVPYAKVNIPFIDVTICNRDRSLCQTIDHVVLDTGSAGLRLQAEAVDAALLAALPVQNDETGRSISECFRFSDGFMFGGVRTANFSLNDMTVVDMPLQIVGDIAFVSTMPPSCGLPGEHSLAGLAAYGAKGVLGIGVQPTDCGEQCAMGATGAAIYYACDPKSECQITSQGAPGKPNAQLPNPVALLPTENNGTIIDLPEVAPTGAQSLNGLLILGISTRGNNALEADHVIDTNSAGLFTLSYNGRSFPRSSIDSGNNYLALTGAGFAACQGEARGFSCPADSQNFQIHFIGQEGRPLPVTLRINDADALFRSQNVVLPGLAGDPSLMTKIKPESIAVNLGVPFFFGRRIYTAIVGRKVAGRQGPFFAF